MSFLTPLAASALPPPRGVGAGDNEIFHVAIFRFANEHINDAVAAFRALASASRKDSGNLRSGVYRGIDDDQEFYGCGALGFTGGSNCARAH